MRKFRPLILTLLVLTTIGILSFKSCRKYLNPHYIDNNAITINEKLFAPDSSIAVVYYTLDVGARGDRLYKSLLRNDDYDNDLSIFNLPPQIVVVKWLDNYHLLVKHDTNEIYRLGATATELDLSKDTIIVNRIKLIVTERIPLRPYSPW